MNNTINNDNVSWKKTLSASAVICALMILSLGLFNRGYLVLVPYAAVMSILVLCRSRIFLFALSVSTFLGFAWVYIARGLYSYSNDSLTLMGMHMFTLIAFSMGLLGVYAIYSQFQQKLSLRLFKQRLLLYSFIYWILLIPFEWIGYHKFQIQNSATSAYSGFFIFNCLHAPPLMQLAYLSFGPVFFIIFYLFERFISSRSGQIDSPYHWKTQR